MARGEVAITKRLKISKAQQLTMLAVLGASLVVGIALSLAVYLLRVIVFNAEVLAAKDEAIVDYSKTIANTGVCKKPANGKVYSADEIKKCDPNNLSVDSVEGSLRYNVLVNMAGNESLESVGRGNISECYVASGRKRTYSELKMKYDEAENDDDKAYYLAVIKMCSALRVIPDALPAQKNEEALMSSLNQIFNLSRWEPESLSPSGSTSNAAVAGLGTIPVSLALKTDVGTAMRVLTNIESSIREFAISTARIEWSSAGGTEGIELRAQATAYYTQESEIKEQTKTISASKRRKK